MRYQGTQAASAKRGGDPGRFGGPPPKKNCGLFSLVGLLYLVTPAAAFTAMVWRHIA